jgi:predicted AAA+ superfamily ATPase
MARTSRGLLTADLGRTNPWWGDPGWAARDPQLRAAAAAPFAYEPAVLADVAPPNLYTLRGPRRAGKSTVLKQTIARLCREVDPRRIVHVAADLLRHARDLTTILQAARALFPDVAEPRYVFVDEVSTVQEWHLALKWLRDNTALASDCVVMSGSSAADVAAGTESLAGRRGPAVGTDRLLLPMAFPEFVRCAGYPLPAPPRVPLADFRAEAGRAAGRDALVHLGALVDAFEAYLAVGGFPQAVADFRRGGQVSPGFLRDLWDVVQSDLRRAGVSRPEVCLRLLGRLLHGTCAPVSFRKLGEELGIDQRTAAAWTDALADAYLAVVLFKEAAGVPDVNSQRKVYLADPALALLPEALAPGAPPAEPGQLAQTVLTLALFRATNGNAVDRFRQPQRLFYHTTRRHTEIDFLVLPERMAAESKYVDTVDRRDGRAMVENLGGGLLLTRTAAEIEAGLTFVPAPIFCWLLEQPV